MSYNSIEKSLDTRQPIRLYEFRRGALIWAYNTSSENVKRQEKIYKALVGGISDKGIIISDGGNSDNFTIIAPADIEIASLFTGMPPSARIELTVYNTHSGTDETIPCWHGSVIGINYSEIESIQIIAQSNDTLTNKPGATQVWSRQCCAVLYDSQCSVNRELYKIAGKIKQVEAASIEVIEAGNKPDGWFNGGFFEYPIGNGEIDRRFIESHKGVTLNLWGGTKELKQGLSVNLYPGCNLSKEDCANKFNNMINRRAFDHIQGRSPFDGNPVGW